MKRPRSVAATAKLGLLSSLQIACLLFFVNVVGLELGEVSLAIKEIFCGVGAVNDMNH